MSWKIFTLLFLLSAIWAAGQDQLQVLLESARYGEAVEELQQALLLVTDEEERLSLHVALSKVFRELNKPKESLAELRKAEQIIKKQMSISPLLQLAAQVELGKTRLVQSAYSEAIIAFHKALEIKLKTSNGWIFRGEALRGMAQAQREQGDQIASEEYLQQAIEHHSKGMTAKLENKALLATQHIGLASLLLRSNKREEAKKMEALALKALETKDSLLVFSEQEFFQNYSQFLYQREDYKKAIQINQKALVSIAPFAFTLSEIYKLPTATVLQNTEEASELLEALMLKARLFTLESENASEGLKLGLKTYQLLDQLYGQLQRDYQNQQTRVFLSNLAHQFYNAAIDLCLKQYKSTQKEDYLREAFRFSERSKCSLLLGAFHDTKAQKIAGVPQTLLKEEHRIKKKIEMLRKDLYSLFHQKTPASLIESKEKELVEIQQEYEKFIKGLEKDYPKYFQLKYNQKVVSIEECREHLLEDDQALIEYFLGDSLLTIFKITDTDFIVRQLPLKVDLAEEIKAFRMDLYSYYLDESKRTDSLYIAYWESYCRRAYTLYQLLISPILKADLSERLVIIPAGVLGYLPFETLLTESVNTSGGKADYKGLPYLIKKYAVGYCYSATLLYEMEIKEHDPENIFLGFAPEFNPNHALGGQYHLSPLEHTQQEVTKVHDLIGQGLVYNGERATKENFEEMCGTYCIVHIATHGVANNRNSNYSFLAFSEADSMENELLYVKDLYNMKLTANLVVLSACETGVGELYGSEGIASLARGFSYAGAKGIVTSLWSVNDQSTAQIMEVFYKTMKDGIRKDDALQKAKLDYIGNVKGQAAHPFFWSAFIQIGDAEPVPSLMPADFTWIAIVAGLLLLLAILFFWRRKRP